MRKIDRAIEEEIMKTGAMGTEMVSIRMKLTDEEKAEFLKTDKYDSDHYYWEFDESDENELYIDYTEEVEG